MPKTPVSRLSLDDLASLASVPRRTVRYYIQIGLVDRPVGETRGAHYTERHLDQLLTARKWTDVGLSLERVRELLAGGDTAVPPPRPRKPGSIEVMSHLVVSDGIELVIEPGRAGLDPAQVRALVRAVLEAHRQIADRKNADTKKSATEQENEE